MITRFFLPLILIVSTVAAQDKPAFDPSTAKNGPLGLPSPYDKFLGLDQVLNLSNTDWKNVYNEIARSIDASKLKGETDIALALGVRVADGIMSIKAKDVQALNESSKEIEELAKKLGVKDEELTRAKTVRADANKGEWLKVFMELGFLQTDIMNSLRSSGNTQRRTLIINAGWMQGLHYTAYVISKHYTGQTSNFLREPLLVKALMADLDELPAAVKSSPKVAVIISGLPAVYTAVNIPLDGTISKEGVEKLFSAAQDVVVKIVGG